MTKTDAFKIEENRAKLASRKRYIELKKTYTRQYHEIPDFNSPELWDVLNNQEISYKGNPMAWDRTEIVSSFVNESNIILDVGFGSGILEKKLFSKFSNVSVHGVDISRASVKHMKQVFPQGYFQVADIWSLPYPDKYFDFVVALEVFEHIKPTLIFKAIIELSRVLKKNGHLIVSVPLNEGLEELVNSGINPNAHVRVYTPDLIKAELEISGFKIKKTRELYAFGTFYRIKSFIARFLHKRFRSNNIIILAEKL